MKLCVRLVVGMAAIGFAVAAEARPLGQTERAKFDEAVVDARSTVMTNPRITYMKAVAAEKLAEKLDVGMRRYAIATTYWMRAEALYQTGDLAAARALNDRARLMLGARPKSSSVLGDVLTTSGSISAANVDVARALTDFQQAFYVFQKLRHERGQIIALICIADLYANGKNYESALRYIDQALELHTRDSRLMLSIYNNRGLYLAASGRNGAAVAQLRKAVELARGLDSPGLESQILRNILRAQIAAGRLADAERTAHSAYAAAARAGGGEKPAMLSAIAQLELQRGRLPEALSLIDRSFERFDLATSTMPMREAHLTAYRIYKASKQPVKALAHLDALKRLDDEATKLATQTSTALMGARFDFANQELRIARLKAEELRRRVLAEQEKARFERMVFAGAGVAALAVLALLATALLTIRRSRDAVRAANADLEVTNAALEDALAAKSEFLAATSHEIRTPLNGILGMTQVMLAENKLPPDALERVRLVHGAGTTMRALVDDLLDAAKLEKGRVEIEREPFDLAELVRDSARLWEDAIRAKGLTLGVRADLPPGRVLGDEARVRQVLGNLLSNAVKFTESGAITVTAGRDGDGTHRITIRDSGIGIAEAKIEHIFEPFRQADASTTRRFGGTGLGLSISRGLARAMGGDLTVDSGPAGSAFTLALPLDREEAPVLALAGPPAGDTILVVDRNPIMRSLFGSLLAPHADEVLMAAGLSEAVAVIGARRPKAVLVDEGAVAAESLGPLVDAAGVPVTLLRAAASPSASHRGVRVVTKPVSGPALVAAMFPAELHMDHKGSLVSRAA